MLGGPTFGPMSLYFYLGYMARHRNPDCGNVENPDCCGLVDLEPCQLPVCRKLTLRFKGLLLLLCISICKKNKLCLQPTGVIGLSGHLALNHASKTDSWKLSMPIMGTKVIID